MQRKQAFEQTTKTVMPRQITQKAHTGFGFPQHLQRLLLRHQVEVRQLHTFRETAGAGGEHDHGQTLCINSPHRPFKITCIPICFNIEQIFHEGNAANTQCQQLFKQVRVSCLFATGHGKNPCWQAISP